MVVKSGLVFLIQSKMSKPPINDAGDSEIGVPFEKFGIKIIGSTNLSLSRPYAKEKMKLNEIKFSLQMQYNFYEYK